MKKSRLQNFADKGYLFFINFMKGNSCQNFRDKGPIFHINVCQLIRGKNFTDEGHPFSIHPFPWYAYKKVMKVYRCRKSFLHYRYANKLVKMF